jgi:peptidoglycan hydrolase CwlO-like protein
MLIFVSILMALAVPMQVVQQVSADQYDDKINALQQEIDNYSAQAAQLTTQADTLQSAVAELQSQAAVIQAQIDISQAKYDKLVTQIADTEKQIKDNQDALGITIANMYVDDQTTPLEMLASSKNISEYLDKQEYRSSVRNQLTSTISKIKDLKAQLDQQKTDVQNVLNDQQTAKNALVAKQNEQQNLLDQTQGQEAAYQSLIVKNKKDIQDERDKKDAYYASLKSEATNISNGDPNKGGYPAYLANSAQDRVTDPWGLYNRECVSYAAWKVHQAHVDNPSKYRYDMPYWGGIGNAWQWAFSGYENSEGEKQDYNTGLWHTSNAESAGIPTGSEPKAGSVAVRNATPSNNDYWGHVAWVESVNDDGTINISQYNWNLIWPDPAGEGQYSEMTVSKSFFQRYIYFDEW